MVPGIYEEVFEPMNPSDERQLLWAKSTNSGKGLFFSLPYYENSLVTILNCRSFLKQ